MSTTTGGGDGGSVIYLSTGIRLASQCRIQKRALLRNISLTLAIETHMDQDSESPKCHPKGEFESVEQYIIYQATVKYTSTGFVCNQA